MIECSKYKLSECCLSISDGDHLPPPKVDAGIPFITISDIDSSNRLNLDVKQFVPEEYYNNLKDIRKAQRNDILYSVVGSFGIPVIIKGNDKFAFQRHIAILRPDPTKVIPDYLFYIMKTYNFYMQADSVAIGAAQRTISLTALRNMTVELPSMDVQKKIATTLSRYDSLIDNYQRQIKLLEEAAQRLYKEWFVKLRFPGHENTKIVDGVPEEWEKKSIDSIYSIKYGKNLSTKLINKSGEYPVYGANGIIGYYSQANCEEQVALITSRGNGSGDVLMTYHTKAFITNNSFIVKPLERYKYCDLSFTFHFILRANFRAVRTGAAQPQLTNQSIHNVDVVLPSKEVIEKYCKIANPFFQEIKTFKHQLRLLAESRDRLLPKLLSGEIEV